MVNPQRNLPYKVIEILMVALIYAIGCIDDDMRTQFITNHNTAIKILKEYAGISISGGG